MIGSILGFIVISVIAAVAYRYRRRNKEEERRLQRSDRELSWAGSKSGLCPPLPYRLVTKILPLMECSGIPSSV